MKHASHCVDIFTQIFKKIKSKWMDFIVYLKKKANPDDESQIHFYDFMHAVRKFGAYVSKEDQKELLQTFPGNEQANSRGPSFNIARIYD